MCCAPVEAVTWPYHHRFPSHEWDADDREAPGKGEPGP